MIIHFVAGDSGVFTLGNGARANDDNASPTDSSQLSQVRDQRHSYDATDGYAPFDGQSVSDNAAIPSAINLLQYYDEYGRPLDAQFAYHNGPIDDNESLAYSTSAHPRRVMTEIIV